MINEGQIYGLMSKVMAEVQPIGKDSKNTAQGYKYRGIDAIYSAFHKVLSENGVFYVPHVQQITREERPGREGVILSFVTVTVGYFFYAADGSTVMCVVAGEGMDFGDKATKKAMTAAVKTLLEQVFCIETGEEADSERDDPEPARKAPKQTCPKCKEVSLIPNQYGSGYYCLSCRSKLESIDSANRQEVTA